MRVYIMRHGPAEERAREDRLRRLTPDGREKTREAARGLAALGAAEEIDVILTSPYVRARETAEIAAEALGLGDRVVETDALASGASPASAWKEIAKRAKKGALTVGHEPDCGLLVRHLLGAATFEAPLKKAGVACVESGERPALVFFAPPALLRALGRAKE